jgi:hypothetical protein
VPPGGPKGTTVPPGVGAGLSGDQAELACPGDGLGAVGRAKLAKDVGDVLFDRVEADHQLPGDLRVRLTGRQQPQHLLFALCQRLDQTVDDGGMPPRGSVGPLEATRQPTKVSKWYVVREVLMCPLGRDQPAEQRDGQRCCWVRPV